MQRSDVKIAIYLREAVQATLHWLMNSTSPSWQAGQEIEGKKAGGGPALLLLISFDLGFASLK